MANAPPNESSSLTLAEEGGGTLKLTKRALPYMPLSIGGKQRAEFVWYPGSPQATVQMLGPEEDVIVLKGFWKDKFIEGTGAAKYVSAEVNLVRSALNSGLNTAANVANVVELVKIVDTMRRMGKRITLSWDRLQRIGHITAFTQTWQTTHYCEWELEFSVVAQEATTIPAAVANKPTLTDIATQAASNRSGVQNAWLAPKPLAITPLGPFEEALRNFDDSARSWTNYIAATAQSLANGIYMVPNVVRSVIATSTGAVNACNTVIGTFIDRSLTEIYAFGSGVGAAVEAVTGEQNMLREDSLPYGIQLGAASYTRGVRSSIVQVRNNNATWRYEYQRQMTQGSQAVSVLAKQAMDLRAISEQYYGTQDYWKQLMLYNGLTSSRLEAGMLVFVPQNSSALVAGLVEGGGY